MVGDDRGGPLHDRFPVGVGDAGDEDPAGREAVEITRRVEDDGRAGTDGLADRCALDQALPRAAVRRQRRNVVVRRRDCTVSGRAWTTASSPVRPSLAHSRSMGYP